MTDELTERERRAMRATRDELYPPPHDLSHVDAIDVARWEAFEKGYTAALASSEPRGLREPQGDGEQVECLREAVVELWHKTPPDSTPELHECLGMTWPEYQAWVQRKPVSTTSPFARKSIESCVPSPAEIEVSRLLLQVATERERAAQAKAESAEAVAEREETESRMAEAQPSEADDWELEQVRGERDALLTALRKVTPCSLDSKLLNDLLQVVAAVAGRLQVRARDEHRAELQYDGDLLAGLCSRLRFALDRPSSGSVTG